MISFNFDTSPSAILHSITDNPINWFLGAVAIYLAVAATTSSSQNIPPPVHPQVIELRNFTPTELSEYDGVKNKKIYMGVNGRVYDVTAGAGFYGPGGPYGNFAGRDASRGLSKDSFDAEMMTPLDQPIDKLEDLDVDEWEALKNWASFFQGKYNHVGYLVEDPRFL
ncbi:hypothetical protein HDV05_004362 [Chytridiales sp. JEL 0842]|nr:hypothetical protein HDV05_004362 [Chytridiales sp. JEL 0842]